jgi:DNA polymerase-3 subunit delta
MKRKAEGAPTPPLVVLHGDDEFAISEHLQRLRALPDFNLNINEFDGRKAGMAEVRGVCDALPFLSPRRLVVLHNAGGKSAEGEEPAAGKGGLTAALVEYLPQLAPFTTLVLLEQRKLPENSRLLKAARKVDGHLEHFCSVPTKDDGLAQWVVQRARAAGGVFSPAAARSLAAAIGSDPRRLAGEVHKLLAFVNWERPVQPADVEETTPAAGQGTIWVLVDALAERDARRAHACLDKLLSHDALQPLYEVFPMIVRQYRLLLQAREVLDSGAPAAELQSALKVHPFVAQKLGTQARRYTLPVLEAIYLRLAQLDVAMKSGTEPRTGLELLVAELTA